MAKGKSRTFWVVRRKRYHASGGDYCLFSKKMDFLLYSYSLADYRVCDEEFERLSGFKMEPPDPPRKILITIEPIP